MGAWPAPNPLFPQRNNGLRARRGREDIQIGSDARPGEGGGTRTEYGRKGWCFRPLFDAIVECRPILEGSPNTCAWRSLSPHMAGWRLDPLVIGQTRIKFLAMIIKKDGGFELS